MSRETPGEQKPGEQAAVDESTGDEGAADEAARAAQAAFALWLHRLLPANGDLCWSPFSVACALCLAAAGARGHTRDELAHVLAAGSTLGALRSLLATSARLPEADVAVANALWLDRRRTAREEFVAQAAELPGAVVRAADFRSDPEGSRRAINADVAETTRGLITDLLAAGTVDADTASVLVNALYLRIAWQVPFPERRTAPAEFHAPTGTRRVPTMHLRERLPYAAAAGWRMVSLPTAGPVAVEILLPDGPAVPAPDPEAWQQLRDAARPRPVALALPRLRVAHTLTLDAPLQAAGVTAAFTPDRADFSGMTEHERFVVDRVVHRAVLHVDEQGFEGAAATGVVMQVVSMDTGSPVPFVVDRPFLLAVRHRRTGALYFLARVEQP